MKKTIITTVILASLLLVSMNIFLILQSDSKINRLTFLSSWQAVKQEDVAKTLQTEGIVQPLEQYPIYFHDKNATFHSFHVKKGDEVAEGTPLFDYTVDHVEAEKARLETEKAKLEDKITSIEDYLDQLSHSKTSFEKTLEKDKENKDFLTFSVDQEMYAKELEIRLLQAEIARFDEKIDELDQFLLEQTLESDYAGTVKEINYDLTNPIMTIHSLTPAIEGILTEKDVTKVETGMKTYISFPAQKGKFEGEISQIQPFPAKDATINKPSEYPFTVSFSEEEVTEQLTSIPFGAHANIRIVLEEANGALTVPTTSIVKEKKDKFIYIITDKGTIKKQPVETGLIVNGKQVILQGVEKGDLFVDDPAEVNGDNNLFFSPIKTTNIKRQAFHEFTKKQKLKYVVYGFLY